MGLADRDYMREEYHPPRVTIKLIVVLIAAFVIESLLIFYGKWDVVGELGLTLDGVKSGKVWQLLTFQFLHAAPWPWHVLLNCLGLYFMGRPVEERLGARKFLTVYLLCGIAGGLLQLAVTWLLPGHPDVAVVGASAGICGIVAIYCTLNPMQELTTWLYLLPVTIRARYVLIFLTALSVFGTIVPFDNVAHAAHLGGILLGMAYARWVLTADFSKWVRKREPTATRAGKGWFRKSAADQSDTDLSTDEFVSKEVDPILEKISAHGIQSLTARERQILEKARAKMAKR